VRTATFNALSFKDIPHLIFNFNDPKSIIISMLNYMHVKLSSVYCLNLLLPKEALNSFTVQESSHSALLHLWVLMYSEKGN
jgi:hypothetical protein